MTDIFISSDNILSPIGLSTAVNFERLKQDISGIKKQDNKRMSEQPFYAALFENDFSGNDLPDSFTKFEKLLIASVDDALSKTEIRATDKKTVFIISTTKGNISLLETEKPSKELNERISLNTSAKLVADHFGFINRPVIISNACISGMLAILTGMRLIQSGQYDHAVRVADRDRVGRGLAFAA